MLWTGLAVGLILLTGAGTAYAQLSADDIAALQQRAKAEGWTFTVGENAATRRPMNELCGLVLPDDWWVDAPFDPCLSTRTLPSRFDWREETGLPPVRDQGSCGSCWAFATVGPLECNIMIKDWLEVDLSEQWLVSCNTNGWGCNGGNWAHMYHESKGDPCGTAGAVMEYDFPYVAEDVPCDCPYPHEYLIDDWRYIGLAGTIPSVTSMKNAIINHGPITAGVYVSQAFGGYNGGVFNACQSGPINHGVTLVGWDDDQGANGVWFLRNSWGPNWGEGGYMRIEYGCNEIGSSACYVVYPGTPPFNMSFPGDTPKIVAPGEPATISVHMEEVFSPYVEGTGQLHYRFDGGTWLIEPLVSLGDNLYEVTLPAATCGDSPEFYFTGQSEMGHIVYHPREAPEITYFAGVGQLVAAFADDFETDQGWTVENTKMLNAGAWERDTPVGLGERGDPPTDFDGSGQCFLTENVYGNSDVDGGTTRLISPTLDPGVADALIHYALWFTNNTGPSPNEDLLQVHVSNDDGENWVLAETIGPITSSGWFEHLFWLGDFVQPTDQIRVRFEVSDLPEGSIVEAGVDDFSLSWVECSPPSCDDGILNQDEMRIDCGGTCAPCNCLTDETCVDALFCNGVETCNASGECQAGSFPCPFGYGCEEETDTCYPLPGACCYAEGGCAEDFTSEACTADSGVFLGFGLSCDTDPDDDGVFGCEDRCPMDPDKSDPGTCGCGTPDSDTDLDGCPDCIDICPDTPIELPANVCGCPAIGACCSPVHYCWDGFSPADCAFIGGIYQGDGSDCSQGCSFGDFDEDGDVDLSDAAAFQRCFTAAGGAGADEECQGFDIDGCGSVDAADAEAFFEALSGP
jgi:hypothetical protein